MSHSIDRFFASNGRPVNPVAPRADCPSDEAFAGFLDPHLAAAERESIQMHALGCADCHELLRMVVDLGAEYDRLTVSPAPGLEELRQRPAAAMRIVARLRQRGIELVNQAELTFRTLVEGGPTPLLDTVRTGQAPADGLPATDWVAIRGPGSGLDELELQLQTNGTARLLVRCENMPVMAPGEVASILLDVDGSAREKRPFAGEPVSFAPVGRGSYRVRLVARAPGGPARPLAEASLELSA